MMFIKCHEILGIKEDMSRKSFARMRQNRLSRPCLELSKNRLLRKVSKIVPETAALSLEALNPRLPCMT